YGLMNVKAANAGVIVNGLLPVFGVILAFLILKERTTKLRIIAIVLILVANLIMMGNPFSLVSHGFGWLFLIGASIVFSSYMFLGKRWAFTTKDVLAFLPIINTVIFVPWWLITDSGIQETAWSQILLQASYQGILVSIGGLLLTFYAVQHIGAMALSIYFSFVPFITSILAWIILKEQLASYEIAGIIFCSVGLLLYAKKSSK
ncbi:MAG: DMT family transporter, partial [Cyclobacteriaceae bacterium]